MTSIIVVAIVGTIVMALITVWEEFTMASDMAISDEVLSAAREEDCRCRACMNRKENAMYTEAFNNPEAFIQEIAKANGENSMQVVWAKALTNQQ